jgi:hypothetical protein
MKLTLGTDSADRKNIPVFSGVIKYAPAAIAGVARISKAGNDKHNPGEPLHHARGKSADHPDCIMRHTMDVADIEAAIERREIPYSEKCDAENAARKAAILNEVSQLTWRVLMWSQELHEKYGGAPLAPGARLPDAEPGVTGWAENTLTDGDVVSVEGVPGTFKYAKAFPGDCIKADDSISIQGSPWLSSVWDGGGRHDYCGNCGCRWGAHRGDPTSQNCPAVVFPLNQG